MRALILNGAATLRDMAQTVESTLGAELIARGYVVTGHDLTTLEIPECKEDFGCWTVTPGVCVHPGPHRQITRDIIRADLVVWLTPVTFGGYSSALKRQLDHCIPLISPWFTTLHGETHHKPRYGCFPGILAVGLVERSEEGAVRVFERVVRRNVLTTYAPHFASPVLARGELPEIEARVAGWVDDLLASEPPPVRAERLDVRAREDLAVRPPRRALLLVGSPHGSASVSAAIATHLAGLLGERGLSVATERIPESTCSDPGLPGLAAAFEEADVVALATPLYVDSLPGMVTAALEAVARHRTAAPHPRPRFLAVVNCGFPEAVHNDTALAICRLFAEQANLDWIGGLGIGGGGMLAGRPLAEQGGRARAVTRALSLTADAIVAGRVVPHEARRIVETLGIPRWLYRFLGERGFRREARKHETLDRVGARPYAV